MLANVYTEQLIPAVIKEAKARGYNFPSIIIAQAIQESGARVPSTLASKYNNFFGMKCGSSWKGKSVNMKTKECYNGATYVTIKDNFRVYDTVEEGVKGYFDFISAKRYENLKTAKSPEEYAYLIKQDGYATGINYAENVIKVMNTYGLKDYDKANVPTPVTEPKKDGKNSIKLAVISIQTILKEAGYNIVVDGIFGPKTMEAYNKYRRS